MTPLILFTVFAATLLLVLGLFTFLQREKLADAEATRARLRQLRGEGHAPVRILRERTLSAVPWLDAMLRKQAFSIQLDGALAQAGMKVSVGTFLLGAAVAGAAGFMLLASFAGTGAGMAGFVVAGVLLPWIQVRRLQRKRAEVIEAQLPDAVDMIVNAMRAGFSLQMAMQFVGRELPAPLGTEFNRYAEEQRLGADSRTALLDLEERVGTLDMKMFVTSLLLQRDTGGSLSEVLTGLSNIIRDRVALRDHIRTLTAEPTATAIVLGILPVLVFTLMWFVKRSFVRPLVATDEGHYILLYAFTSVLLGYLVLRRMADVDI